jgi:translocator protein
MNDGQANPRAAALRQWWRGPARVPSLWAAFGVLLVAVLGGLATQIGPWYLALRQPPWKPPDLWFGPAWSVIYTLTAVAAVRAWMALASRPRRLQLLIAFALNGVLNIAWSVLFFSLRRPDWALVQVGGLWASIAVLAWMAGRADTWAGLLLLPYLCWVAFAAALNAAVVQLNGPF